jgi:adenylate kinase
MINLAMIGYSGSGKSTMASEISDEFKLFHIETGRIFRKMIDEQSEKGKELEKYISRGELVPDNLVCEIVDKKIEENKNARGIIFDGFPRTRGQAEFLDKKLTKKSTTLHFAFLLKIKGEIAKNRKLEVNSNFIGNPESPEKIVDKRIEQQRVNLVELRKYYNRENKLFEYDASTSPESVQWGIKKIIMRKIET